jgi:hypothetical protein
MAEYRAVPFRATQGHRWGCKVRVMVALDPDARDEVDELARELNVRFSEAVRIVIEWGLEARRQ